MILLRDLIVQGLRSRNYEILSVPDDLSLVQSIDWINSRANVEDVALEIHANAYNDPTTRGVTVFHIANNAQRKYQAELLLQAYLRRIPQMPTRGAKPDTQTGFGSLAFCRWVTIPSLLMEVAILTNPEDRRLIQRQRQDMAIGIADGLAAWSRGDGNPTPPESVLIDINLNNALYDDKGILRAGNAYVPLDLIEQILDLPLEASVRRINYHGVVYVRAIDLRDFNVAVSWDANSNTVNLRSSLEICPDQINRIMGHGKTSEVQMMMFLKSNNPEGLTRFPELPRLYREEAKMEGVNYDIAFAQMCVDTSFLRFGGAVEAEQNNFAQLGGIGSGPGGASFASARLGVRAQIQHLKAYASTEPLAQATVDPRFRFVRRGITPLVDQLSGRWTADERYGSRIIAMVRRLYESAGFL
jgi:hypothetical protein